MHSLKFAKYCNIHELNVLNKEVKKSNKKLYKLLNSDFKIAPNKIIPLSETLKNKKSIQKTIELIIQTDKFKKIYEETIRYSDWLSSEWNKNKINVNEVLKDILRIKMSPTEYKVFITHPKLRNGRYVGHSTICWGHSEDWDNYSMVYLVHEALHEILVNRSPVMHAIIELIADNELRIRLNKKGKYFEVRGHQKLKKIEKIIYPHWRKYLKNKSQNIMDFFENTKKIKQIYRLK